MQIGFVIPYFYPAWEYGGPPRSAFELARALTEKGHCIRVLTTDTGGRMRLSEDQIRQVSYLFGDRLTIRYCPNLSNYLAFRHRLFLAPGLTRLIRQELAGMDVLHFHEFRTMTSVAGHRVAAAVSIPYVLSPHGGLRKLGKGSIKTIFDGLWGRIILRDAAAVATVSRMEARQAKAMGVPSWKIQALPNPVRVEDYLELPERGLFRRRRSIGPGKMVLFLGRLNRIKGVDLAVQACAKIKGSVHLVVAGPDDGQEAELRAMTKVSSASVVFTGFLNQEEKLSALVDADVCVLPSRDEIFGMVALEALLADTPVVLSSACGLAEEFEGRAGVLTFQSENVNDLAEKLTFAFDNLRSPGEVAESKRLVTSHFSLDSVADAAESMYLKIAGARA